MISKITEISSRVKELKKKKKKRVKELTNMIVPSCILMNNQFSFSFCSSSDRLDYSTYFKFFYSFPHFIERNNNSEVFLCILQMYVLVRGIQ